MNPIFFPIVSLPDFWVWVQVQNPQYSTPIAQPPVKIAHRRNRHRKLCLFSGATIDGPTGPSPDGSVRGVLGPSP